MNEVSPDPQSFLMRQSSSSKQLDDARNQRKQSKSRDKATENKINSSKIMIEKVQNDWT